MRQGLRLPRSARCADCSAVLGFMGCRGTRYAPLRCAALRQPRQVRQRSAL